MNDKTTPYYDLILHYTSHRRHEVYLNIIQYLGKDYRIGILFLRKTRKWNHSDDVCLEQCQQFGAEIIEGPAECDCFLFARVGFEGSDHFTDLMEEIPSLIKYRQALHWPAGYLNGVLEVEKLVEKFGDIIVLTPSLKFFGTIETEVKSFMKTYPLKLVEVGFPYGKYPIIEGFSADYLLAYPSHVLVKDVFRQYSLLAKLVNTLRSLPSDANIYLKTHNARDHGSKVSYNFLSKYNVPSFIINSIAFTLIFFDREVFGKRLYSFFPNIILTRLSRFLNDYIFTRCKNLLDEFPGFGIEHYIPHVKGIITAPSASINTALYEEVPVYICDVVDDKTPPSYKIMYDLYGMEEWKDFSSLGFSKISDSSRKASIIESLKQIIQRKATQEKEEFSTL
jgi:hypothetical protein